MRQFIQIILFVLLLSIGVQAEEGVVIETKTTTDMMGMGGTEIISTAYYRANAKCEITKAQTTGLMTMQAMDSFKPKDEIYIVLLDKNEGYRLYTADSTYSVLDISAASNMLNKDFDSDKYLSFETSEQKELKKKAEAINWITKVDTVDVIENINGFPCKFISYETSSESEDTSGTMVVTQKYWWCNEIKNGDIYNKYMSRFISQLGVTNPDLYDLSSYMDVVSKQYYDALEFVSSQNGITIKNVIEFKMIFPEESIEKITDSMLADSSNESEVEKGSLEDLEKQMLSMFAKMSDDDNSLVFSSESEILSINGVILSDTLFEIPEGYKLE